MTIRVPLAALYFGFWILDFGLGFGRLSAGEKGDSPHLCEAPSGPFRQMGAVPFFLAQAQPGKSLEEQLLDDRSAHSLDPDADRDLSKPAGQGVSGPAKPDSTKRGPVEQVPLDQQVKELRQKLSRELGPAGVAEDENPLLQVARQMQQAESLLANPQPGAQTKQVQEQIVANLDRLLKSCENSSCSPGAPCTPKPGDKTKPGPPGKPGTKPNPNGAKSGSRPKEEPAQPKDEAAVRKFQEFIARLPPSERVQVQALSIEEFLPKYKPLIEAYFRDLAEEQSSGQQE
jgi:hypothetical protein